MTQWFEREALGLLGGLVQQSGWLTAEVSRLVVNKACNSTRNRPHPWSTYADYPCWEGLFDRSYLARHLPPVYPDPAAAPLPAPEDVAQLFARPEGGQQNSRKSTCLFPAFAQYLTDGFIRTMPGKWNRTTSNHEIDLCPLYGLNVGQTNALRRMSETPGEKGKLKSQVIVIAGVEEEFPPFLYDAAGATCAEFAVLDPPLFNPNQPASTPDTRPAPPAGWEAGRAASLFALGGDRANSTPFTAMMNTLLLREHNRVAGELEAGNPAWNDDRVFQTARNIMIPIFIKIVVEEYINHIAPLPFNIRCDPSVAWNAAWNRPNWMTAEFSLLYRWHSLMPDQIAWADAVIPIGDFTLDNRPLLRVGLDAAFSAAAAQPTSKLGARNTAANLLPIEILSVNQARFNHLAPYNAYRQAFGMQPAQAFSDISSDPVIQAKLEALYATPDRVEFYPGLFAEDRVADSALPALLMTMVAVDAFSQALTNPLLSQHVWQDNPTLTFTDWGMTLIEETASIADILHRQGRPAAAAPVSMTQASWTYASD
jgi:prostaglandin-endoperoxide synthase 2